MRRRSRPADPAVAPGHIPGIDGGNIHRAAEPPALALQEQRADLPLAAGGVVGGHQPHRISGEQPAAVRGGTPGQQQPPERQPVIDGPGQSAAAQRERGRRAPLPVRTVGQLVGMTAYALRRLKNFGEISLAEVRRKLAERGLKLAGD